ncbi:hypothetical protein CY34DRAFT_18689 [Suillus luteus UH-Slu-Lm8-n1]|uniref:Uncharacterized protein n=1 Tax=Suillus luteus UH-Slu-Lm8-n1 TaxID=930992 RepID=A0A0D0AM10_9AGAM|nr:hypothetical protein CY34DRAFT_18689 [Suillus luteus UH-Slu-Lm8-n1]
MGNAAATVFCMPITVDGVKRTSVDGIVNGVEVRTFVDNLSNQTKNQITLAGVSMALDIAILAVPGLGTTVTSQILCSCSLLFGVGCIFAGTMVQHFGDRMRSVDFAVYYLQKRTAMLVIITSISTSFCVLSVTSSIFGFLQLLDSYPSLLERLKTGSKEEIIHVGELIGKGAAGARGDDTKTLKSAVLDWIPLKGAAIQPPLHRNSKINRGINHKLTGSLLCPAGMDWNDTETKENLRSGEMLVCGDQWPIFLYTHHTFDTEDPWCGLLRSRLLAYKHVFTSPSSVNREPKATRSGNARLHGMNSVTIASIAYVATQVQFALSSSSVFSWTDTTTDSETFYHSLLDLFEDPDESKEVDDLLTLWNRQVFPTSSAAKRPISANSALLKIRLKRMTAKQAASSNIVSS